MRFQTPQFIGIEDKVLGQFTLKQFVYLAGSAGSVALLDYLLPRIIALIIGAPIVIFGCMLAFYKYNGKPFVVLVESMFGFALGAKLYIWRKKEKKIDTSKKKIGVGEEEGGLYVPKLSDSKLKDLAWSLDIHDITQENRSDRPL